MGCLFWLEFFTWLVSQFLGGRAGWIALGGSIALFFLVVWFHRRVDWQLKRHQIWRGFRADQSYRQDLVWENIPAYDFEMPAERTSLDIDLDLLGPKSIHHLLDMSVTKEGGGLLASWLTVTVPAVSQIETRQKIVLELVPAVRFRDRMRLEFRMLSHERLRGKDLLAWLNFSMKDDHLHWLLPISTVLIVINVILFVLNAAGRLPPYWAATLFIYGVFYFTNIRPISEFLDQVVRLDAALDGVRAVLKFLENYPYGGQEQLARFCAPFRDRNNLPSKRMRRVKLVTAAVGLRMNPVLSLVINLILPWDFFFAYLGARLRNEIAEELPLWLKTWNELEALISLANFAYLNPGYQFPRFVSDASPVFHAAQLGHPLLPPDQKRTNDFSVRENGEIIIVTGSNMAGKSTFIKTIGVNMCLAYAGAPVAAAEFSTVPFRLHSCIRISDSLADGYSYFYAEVKCLKRLLETLDGDGSLPVLYLIDEIYRGTNNREQLLGSRAFIKAVIGKSGVGFLATHDLELAALADFSPLIRNYHFRDRVESGRLVFDYQIRPGPSPTTNALRIMQMEGLPVEQVELE